MDHQDDCDGIDLNITLEKYGLARRFLLQILDQLTIEAGLQCHTELLANGRTERLVLASGGNVEVVQLKFAGIRRWHFGCIRLTDARQIRSLYLHYAPPLQDSVNFEHELCLDQMLFRVRHDNIPDYIIAPNLATLLAHAFLPFAICSAARNRCSIVFMSIFGVPALFLAFF